MRLDLFIALSFSRRQGQVPQCRRQAVGQQHHELQETLCDAVLAAVLSRPEVQAARVATRKPDVYADSASVGVERVAVKPWWRPS